ncbi:unnamed protein product [Phyllotreta striolata]|uniref:Cytochrome b-c1 complex subunit 8 n=1 Tax=Phyllotreta striolata TaxID=444603 RepID=A0A9N9TPB5_PHYSR|nr:unnamed protein product [Phyllotreta striolata]
MGHHPQFGNLYYLRNIISYRLSPYHLKSYPALNVKKIIRRIREQIPYIGPPFATLLSLMYILPQVHDKLQRKVPGQFDNEEIPADECKKEEKTEEVKKEEEKPEECPQEEEKSEECPQEEEQEKEECD